MRKRIIFHIDVNSAFLSWEALEQLKNGSDVDLRTIPSIVGGDPSKRHGIVLAKSIPAKKFGIVTGEPVFQAIRKCPDLTIVPPSHHIYAQQSKAMSDLLLSYTPDIEKFSIDECFMDTTGLRLRYGEDYMALAREIKDKIRDKLGFTVNIGISENKLLAKMASDFQKPDRIHTLFPEEIQEKMWPLPVTQLYMVGKASASKFNRMGIKTIGDLANTKPDLLEQQFKKYGSMIWNYANGLDDSPVQSQEMDAKDLSNETTVSFDITDKETARLYILSLSETVGMRLRKAGLHAGVVAIHLKNSDFETYSRQKKLENATQDTNTIFSVASALFEQAWKRDPIRLIGVATSQLQRNPVKQLDMFDLTGTKQTDRVRLEESIDKIREKFGHDYVTRGSLLHFRQNQEKNK
ncbi:MAG: DNA polymerase IV [Clostridiaceae bacterium]|jgi:DNA polymerase-4|nr:DNA polymerase IV [Clostridiaceae bacterium]